jgi:hypothetical protein
LAKTEAPPWSNTEIKERLAVAIQIHAADFDAGLAALQAADLLTTSAPQIAFCGSVDLRSRVDTLLASVCCGRNDFASSGAW